ncbi:MAG: sulfite exporter TauE/SafE family protein [Planctomycetes bacterium]|nr:sulfite exporter TauE/SafE family protein [Planctomycetota bacterium]
MPELFPTLSIYCVCAVIVVVSQLIYAAVGFGSGLFALSTMALLVPDLAGVVVSLFALNVVTEVVILTRIWRQGRLGLLLSLVPTTLVGIWLGTEVLKKFDLSGDFGALRRVLGIVVVAMGLWFFVQDRATSSGARVRDSPSIGIRWWIDGPTGLIAGTLMALFGTGGPPIVAVLKTHNVTKAVFRATMVWYFFVVSLARAGTYLSAGMLEVRDLIAAGWLLPPAFVGMALGLRVHRALSEFYFARAVSTLLVILGLVLVIGAGAR